MTQTTGIGNAHIPDTALGAVERTAVRSTAARTASKDDAAFPNGSGTTKFSGLGSILAAVDPDTTDVRADKVAALKSAIESGSYNVPASAIADKLISGLLS